MTLQFQILISGIGLLVIIASIGIWRAIIRERKIARSPLTTIKAKAIKKTFVESGAEDTVLTRKWSVKFLCENGTAIEMTVHKEVFHAITEGDEGLLTYQFTRFRQFNKKIITYLD